MAALADPAPFLQRLFGVLAEAGVDVGHLLLDHVCYRAATRERYKELCAALDLDGERLSESTVGGRPIATYRMAVPFVFGGRRIDVVEIPAPKPGSHYPEGYEHAEFVVQEDLLAFARRHQGLPWELAGLSKPRNAEVRLRFGGISAKFHRSALAEVIAEEEQASGGSAET